MPTLTFKELNIGDQFTFYDRTMVKINKDEATPIDSWYIDPQEKVKPIKLSIALRKGRTNPP